MKLKKIGSTLMASLLASNITLSTVSAMSPTVDNDNTIEINSTNEFDSNVLLLNDTTEEDLSKEIELRKTFNSNTSNDQLYSLGQIKLAKIEFQNLHGLEDKFKFVSDENGVKTEVNGYRGLIKLTSEEDGEIVLNYFDSLDSLYEDAQQELKQAKAPSRPSAWRTQGPDKANLKVVKGSSRDTIYAYSPSTGHPKKYTKKTNDWYSGSTKGYYDNVQNARRSWGSAKNTLGDIPMSVFSGTVGAFVMNGNFSVTASTIKAALIAGGVAAAVVNAAAATGYAAAYFVHLDAIRSNYNSI